MIYQRYLTTFSNEYTSTVAHLNGLALRKRMRPRSTPDIWDKTRSLNSTCCPGSVEERRDTNQRLMICHRPLNKLIGSLFKHQRLFIKDYFYGLQFLFFIVIDSTDTLKLKLFSRILFFQTSSTFGVLYRLHGYGWLKLVLLISNPKIKLRTLSTMRIEMKNNNENKQSHFFPR